MKEDVFFIEFTGLPGAGKTTVAHRVAQLLLARDHSVYTRENLTDHRTRLTRFERGLSLLVFVFRNFYLVMNIIFFGFLFRPINFFSLKYAYGCVRTVFKISTAIKTAGQAGHDMVIFDQGILQDLWSIGVTGTPGQNKQFGDHLFKLLKHIRRIVNYSTVLFEIHSEQAAERILARSPSPYRFDNMDRKTILDTLRKKSDYLQLIVETAARLNSHRQLVIDMNSASVETSAQRVASFISNEIHPVSLSPDE